MIQNYVDYISDILNIDFIRTIATFWGYTVRPVILIMFFYILNKDRSFKLFWGLAGINAAVYLTAFFSKVSFWIENGRFNRGPLGFTCHIISLIMLVYFLYLTICELKRSPKRETIIPVLNVLLIFVGIGIDYFVAHQQMISYLTVTIVSGSLFYYIWLHLRFVREHERALMAEQRIQIMMTQIQPHFLYNTLSTIQALCRIDPEKAFDMNGLVLAAKLKKQCPDMKIIFLTGYSEYAVDAFKLHASGYIMKPVGKERLLSEIEYAMSDEKQAKVPAHIEAHTFGEFDLIIDGEPAAFTRAKAKELLAYLIDRHGHSVSRANVFAVLFEDKQYDRSMQKQLDVIIRSLRDTLRKYGSEDIFELSRGTLRIRPEMIDCDMYRFMNGDIEAINSYRGEYMNSYSWAAITEAFIAQERYDEK